jgi:hypothetical protein
MGRASFKAKVALAAIKGDWTVAELANDATLPCADGQPGVLV